MSDFTSEFWNWYVAVLTVVSIIGCAVLLWMQTTRRAPGAKIDTTGHVWDEDLQEWNNPLPNWWRWLFYITVVFSLVYLAFYPGLGSFRGSLGWSQTKQYEDEVKKADATYGPIYAKYATMDFDKLAGDANAMAIGQNLYLNYCAQCHASDARGAKGFPNLADADWQWGGDPKVITETILNGRMAVMPPQGAALGPEGVKDVAHYVMSLSGMASDSIRVARGKEKFATVCAACHGPDGKGNPALGAPNLTDKVWLYGGSEADIVATLQNGRTGQMPAWKGFLGEAKSHLVAAYVWSIGNKPAK